MEIVRSLPIREPYPVYKHRKAVDRIRATIAPVLLGRQSAFTLFRGGLLEDEV